jgi:hypothetical protein
MRWCKARESQTQVERGISARQVPRVARRRAGKLVQFFHLRQRAIDPAVLEVNGLGEFGCKIEPVYTGRKVTAVRLSWWAKTLEEKKATFRELRVSRFGRRARLLGTAEQIAPEFPRLPARVELPAKVHSGLTEVQFNSLRAKFPGINVQEMGRQFVEWNAEKGVTPDNYCGALFGFIRQMCQPDTDVTEAAIYKCHSSVGGVGRRSGAALRGAPRPTGARFMVLRSCETVPFFLPSGLKPGADAAI